MTLAGWPAVKHEINTRDPNDPGGTDNWIDCTPDVSKFSIQRGKADELTTIGPGTMTWETRGTDGRWDPDNAASPYYPYLTAWRQVRTSATWPHASLADTFVRANNLAAVGTASDGGTWANDTGDWFLESNSLRKNAGATTMLRRDVGWTAADVTVVWYFTSFTRGRLWIAYDPVADVGYYYEPWAGPAAIIKGNISGSSRTVIGAVTGIATGYTVRLTYDGAGTLKLYLNGTLTDTVVDSSPITSAANTWTGFTATQGYYVSGHSGAVNTGEIWTSFTASPIGVTSYLFTGYNSDGWTTAFASRGRREFGKAQFADALAVGERVSLLDVTLDEMLSDAPLALYPLDDGGGAQAGNRSATRQANAVLANIGTGITYSSVSPPGFAWDGVNTAAFTAAGIVPTTGTTSVVFTTGTSTGATFRKNLSGAYLQLPPGAYPTALGSGFSVELWFATDVLTTSSGNSTLEMFSATDPTGTNAIHLYIGTGGTGAYLDTAGGGSSGYSFTAARYDDGLTHHAVLTLDSTGKHVLLYIDGAQVTATVVASGTALDPTALGLWRFGQPLVANTTNVTVSTRIAEVTVYPTVLSGSRVAAHYHAGYDGFAGETAGARITRLLSYIGWLTALTAIDTTSTGELDTPLQGARQIAGNTVTAELLHVADSTGSDLDVDGQGRIRYRSRDYRLAQTAPVVTFGPDLAGGQVPYSDPAPEVGKNPKFTYPQVEVDQREGITALGSDATSVQKNFEQKLTKRDVLLADPSQVLDLRDDLLRRYKDGHNRVTPITLNPAALTAIWPQVLGLDTAQRCRTVLTPQTAPGKTVEGYVEAFTHTVDLTAPVPWQTTVTTSAAPPFFPWILGDPIYGVLGVSTVPSY